VLQLAVGVGVEQVECLEGQIIDFRGRVVIGQNSQPTDELLELQQGDEPVPVGVNLLQVKDVPFSRFDLPSGGGCRGHCDGQQEEIFDSYLH
jgi:hypothetical protein